MKSSSSTINGGLQHDTETLISMWVSERSKLYVFSQMCVSKLYIIIYSHIVKPILGLEQRTGKEKAHPARVADVGQENIETVHKPEPIQAADTLCMDKVAVL